MPLEFWRVRLLRDYAKWSSSLRLASAGGGKGGGSTTSNTQQNQNVSYNPYAQPTIADIYNRAAYVSNTPYQPYNGQLVANLDPSQTAGIQSNSAYANYAQPFIGAGTQYTQDAANMVGNAYNTAGYGTNLLGAGANVAGYGAPLLGAGANIAGMGVGNLGAGSGMIGAGFGNMQSGAQAIGTGQNMIGQGFQSVGTGQNMIGNSYNQFPTAEQMAAQAYNSLGYGQGMINQGYPTIGTAQNLVGQSYGGLGQGQGMIGAGMNLAYGGLPYVQGGAGGINAGQNALGLGINQAMGANPYVNSAAVLGLGGSNAVGSVGANDINQYLNPYLQTALGGTLANINQQNAIQQNQVLGNAAAQGALGGDRSAVAQAELARNQALAQNQVIGQMENQGYQQAVQTALTQQQNQQANLARELQASGQLGNLAAQKNIQGAVLGGLGQGLAGTGQQFAGLGMDIGQMGNLVGGLGTQYGNLAGLGANVGTQYGNLGALTGQLGSQYANIGGLAGQLAGMYGNLLGTQGGLGGQYGQLGGVAGQLGLDYAQTGAMLGNIGAQEAGAGSAMGNIGSQYGNLGSQIAGIGGQYGNLGSQIAGIGGQFGNLGTQMGGLGGQYGGMGAQMANLGLQGQTAGLQGAQGQIGAGTLAQQTQQAQLTAAYQQYLQALAYPYQQSQFLANIGLPAAGAMGGYQTQIGTVGQVITPPGMSWGQAALGAGLLGAGLASDTGLFNSSPMAGTGGFTGQVDPTTGNPIAARGGRIIHKDIGGPVSPSTTSLAADALFGGQAAQPNYASLLGINSGFNAPNFGFGSGNGGMGGFSPFMPPNIGGSSFSMPPASPIGVEHYVLNPGQSGELPGQTVMSAPQNTGAPQSRETDPLSNGAIASYLSRMSGNLSPFGQPQMTQMVDANGAPVQGAAPTPNLPSGGFGNVVGGFAGKGDPTSKFYNPTTHPGVPTGAIGQNQVTAPIPMQQPGTPYYIPPSISSYGVQNPLGTISPNQNQFMVGPSPINFAAASGGSGVAGGGTGGSGMMGGFSSPYGMFPSLSFGGFQTPSFSPYSFSQPTNPFQQALQYFGPSLGSFNPYAGGNFSTAFSGAPSIQQPNAMAPFSTSAMTGTQMVQGPNGIMSVSANPTSTTGTGSSPDSLTPQQQVNVNNGLTSGGTSTSPTLQAGNSFPQVANRGGAFFYKGGTVYPPVKKADGGSLMPWDVMVPNMTNPTSMTPNVMGSGVIPNMPIPNINVAMPKPLPSTGGITKSQQPSGSSLSQMMQLMKMGQSMKGLFGGGSNVASSAGQASLLSGAGGDTLGSNTLAPVATKIPSISGGAAAGADMGIGTQSGAGTLGLGAGPASITGGTTGIGGVAQGAAGASQEIGLGAGSAPAMANAGLAGGADLAGPMGGLSGMDAAASGLGASSGADLTGLAGTAGVAGDAAAAGDAIGTGTEAAAAAAVDATAAEGLDAAFTVADTVGGGILAALPFFALVNRGGRIPHKADGGLISAPPTIAAGDAPLLQQAFLLERQRKLQEALSQHAAPPQQGQGFAQGGDVGINMMGDPGRHGVIPVGSPIRTPQVNYGHMIPLIPPMNPETATRNDNIYTTLLQSQATRDAMRNLRGAKRGGPIRGYDDGGDVPFPADDTFSAPDLPADAPAVEDTGQQDVPLPTADPRDVQTSMPIDRSQFLDQIDKNPALVQRMADMVKGEVGLGGNTEQQQTQLESMFNRAQARGIPLEQALRPVSQPGGYYARQTYSHSPVGGQTLETFKNDVLQPVLKGSNVGYDKLGFVPTGNASGSFAANRAANGIYGPHEWWKNTDSPGVNEMYVTEKFPADMRFAQNVAGGQPIEVAQTSRVPMPYPRPQGSSPYLDAGPPRQAPRQSMFSQVASALNPIGTAEAAETGQGSDIAQSDKGGVEQMYGVNPWDYLKKIPSMVGGSPGMADVMPPATVPAPQQPSSLPQQPSSPQTTSGLGSGGEDLLPKPRPAGLPGPEGVPLPEPRPPAISPQPLPVQRQAPQVQQQRVLLQQQQAAQARAIAQAQAQRRAQLLMSLGAGILSGNPSRGPLGAVMSGAASGVANYQGQLAAQDKLHQSDQQHAESLALELRKLQSSEENISSQIKHRQWEEEHGKVNTKGGQNMIVGGKHIVGYWDANKNTYVDGQGNPVVPERLLPTTKEDDLSTLYGQTPSTPPSPGAAKPAGVPDNAIKGSDGKWWWSEGGQYKSAPGG